LLQPGVVAWYSLKGVGVSSYETRVLTM